MTESGTLAGAAVQMNSTHIPSEKEARTERTQKPSSSSLQHGRFSDEASLTTNAHITPRVRVCGTFLIKTVGFGVLLSADVSNDITSFVSRLTSEQEEIKVFWQPDSESRDATE